MGSYKKGTTKVVAYRLDGRIYAIYDSAIIASKKIGCFPRSIDKCIRGDCFTIHNLIWKRFPNDSIPKRIEPYQKVKKSRKAKPIAKVDENGNIIETYPSIKSASEINHIDSHTIRDILSNKYNYSNKVKFIYLDDKK